MLLIVGLDGATWDLLTPFMQQGRLPHLQALRDGGTYGPLQATMPPATFPSWTTFMTGVNPGRHGIFDFTRRVPDEYRVRFVNATFRKAPTVWRLLSDAGRRVAVLGIPGTYPPEEINGVMLSGFDTPVTTRADASFIHPPELAAMVEANGGFPFADFQEFRVGPGWHRMAREHLLRGIATKLRLAKTLLGRGPWDCFAILFGESDTVAHHFWRFHDTASPRYDAAAAVELGDSIAVVYEALDAAVGELRKLVPDADVLIASDHGFGGTGSKAVYLNRWLQQTGWLQFRATSSAERIAGQLKRRALEWIPPSWQARLFRWNDSQIASRLESQARFAGIDWQHTRAFSEELNYFPNLWLNVRGREPGGTIEAADYERARDDLSRDLAGLRDPQCGAAIVKRAWRREELYHGSSVGFAPDLILELNEDGGYSYACLPSGGGEGEAVRQLSGADYGGGKLTGMSGSHRLHGVFLCGGPRVAGNGRVEGVQIADMAPTILNLCEVGAPADFDGETVQRIVIPNQQGSPGAVSTAAAERVYGADEEAEIAARLTDLGYLE